MSDTNVKRFFIAGVSIGFGRALATAAPDAVQSIDDELATLHSEMAAWERVSLPTNFS